MTGNKFFYIFLRIFLGAAGCVLVAIANVLLVIPWFGGQGPANLGSIEVSYVSMARFLTHFSPNLSFAPYWYFGFPFHVFYTPLVPVLEAVANQVLGLNLWPSYRLVTGIALIAAPVSLTLFAWYLTKKIFPAILAGLSYTFLPTVFNFVLPTGEVAADNITKGMFDSRRLVLLARWGEGPHLVSLIFLPLAGLFYLKALRSGKFVWILSASIFTGLTALTNAVGLYGLAILFIAVLFSYICQKPKVWNTSLKTTVFTALLMFGLVAFWYNLTFMGTFFSEGGGVLKNYLNLFPWGILLIVFIGIGFYFLFGKLIKSTPLAISLLWFGISFFIVFYYYVSAPPQFSSERIELAPQALRLMAEVDMAFSLVLASLVSSLMYLLEKRNKFSGLVAKAVGLGSIILVVLYGLSYLSSGQDALSGEVDLSQTGEKQIADWINANVDSGKGERAFLGGNYAFYLNYFSDAWQVRGSLYQAKTHYWPEHIYYQVVNGKDRNISLNWLKIANAKYIVVNTDSSRELYKDFKTPEKFSGLEKAAEYGGDIIYKVPLKNPGPVKVVSLDRMSGLTVPVKGDDALPIANYAGWIESAKPGEMTAVNNDSYKIKANIGPGEAILVQLTYDAGFKASTGDGSKVKISKDPLGFMILEPSAAGISDITLVHGNTWKIWLGYLITGATVLFLLGRMIMGLFRPRRKDPV